MKNLAVKDVNMISRLAGLILIISFSLGNVVIAEDLEPSADHIQKALML